MSTTSFPDVIVAEFDAVAIHGDVVVFATGHSALLLLETKPSEPVELEANQRDLLSVLSRPTLSKGPEHLRLAAIANAGTVDAQILYGEIPLAALRGP